MDRTTTARRIKAAMALAGISKMPALAKASGVSGNRVYQITREQSDAKMPELRAIASACGIPLAFLTMDDLATVLEEQHELEPRLRALEERQADLVRLLIGASSAKIAQALRNWQDQTLPPDQAASGE